MNISFDLDGTLIPNGNEFDIEKRSRITEFFGIEKIRAGSFELISGLQKAGHKVHFILRLSGPKEVSGKP